MSSPTAIRASTRDAPPAPRPAVRLQLPWRRIVLLLVCWLLAAASQLWTAPWHASTDQLRAAMDSRSAVTARQLAGRPHSPLVKLFVLSDEADHAPDGRYLVWADHTQRQHWIDLDEAAPVLEPVAAADRRQGSVPEQEPDGSAPTRHRQLAATFETHALGGGGTVSNLGVLLAWLVLVCVQRSRPTRTATLAFWTWVSFLPAGIGLLWYLHDELLGRGRWGRCRTGWWGLGALVLAHYAVKGFLA